MSLSTNWWEDIEVVDIVNDLKELNRLLVSRQKTIIVIVVTTRIIMKGMKTISRFTRSTKKVILLLFLAYTNIRSGKTA